AVSGPAAQGRQGPPGGAGRRGATPQPGRAGQPLPSPGTPQTFRAGTVLVPLDVRVLDNKGAPITDLTAADFIVTENGVPQRIQHFSFQTLTPEPALADEPLRRRSDQPVPLGPRNYRVFLIYLGRGDLRGPAEG